MFGCLLDELQWFHLATLRRTFWPYKPLEIFSLFFICKACCVLIFCLVDWEFLALRNFKRSEILKMLVMFKSILMIYRCCDIHLCWNFAVMFLDIAFIWTFFWSIHCWMKSFSNQYIVICPVNYELMLIKLTTW